MSEANSPSVGGQRLVQSAVQAVAGTHGDHAWNAENVSFSWGSNPLSLASESTVERFACGTGEELFTEELLPGVESTERNVVIVTCFWALSPSLTQLGQSLQRLSDKVLRRGDGSRIKVFIGLSSRSLLQKIFHTSDPGGYVYPPSTWTSKLGLPAPEKLSGLDMTIKSRFFRPFSVMHPKFVLVDGQTLWMPSCNVSWESWFEGCLALRGPVVQQIIRFCDAVWKPPFAAAQVHRPEITDPHPKTSEHDAAGPLAGAVRPGSGQTQAIQVSRQMSMVLLPSQHHSSLRLSLPMWPISEQMYPPTPLNSVLVHLISTARETIEFITPNLTCPPVVDAIAAALGRGVDVTITTNQRMMVVEQLLTSFTITEYWISKLIRKYREQEFHPTRRGSVFDSSRLLEEGHTRMAVGRLEIHYFRPPTNADGNPIGPVKSHVKCTTVDNSVIVLGSGNMDRASWFTSQELGIALCDPGISQQIKSTVMFRLRGRTWQAFPSVSQ